MTDPVAILANALYVPERLVQPHHLHPYTYEIETRQTVQQTHLPPICENCDRWGKKWRQGGLTCADKNYGLLDSCHLFAHKTEREKVVTEVLTYSKEGEYYVFPRGDLGKIERTFHGIPIHDMRAAPALGFDLEFKYKLRPDQQEVFDAWMRHGYGIVQASTGWGKTVLMSALFAAMKVRILILTDKLRNLQVVEEGLREATNLNDLEKEYGTTLCGVLGEEVRYRKDGKKYVPEKPGLVYPITLSTYQSLTSARGRTLLPHLQNYFGCVWHEEGHHEAAKTYHYVTKSLNPYYRGGQTATPTRGDQMHMVLYDTVGPVTAKSTTPAWTPKATFINTGVHVPDSCFRGMYALVNVETWLSRERAYFDHVRDAVLEDLQNGRKVLVYSKRVAFNHKLRQTLHMAGYGAESIDGKSKPKEQAWYTQQILEGKLDVIIGTSVIAENYNIPPLDCLHLPFTNFTEETEKQIVGRILRSNVANKPQPLIRVYTWTANQSVAKTAAHWRRQLYKKLRYEIEPDRNIGKSIIDSLED